MRWFKHNTDDRNKLASKIIKRKFGVGGYGMYICLLEVIAEHVEPNNIDDWGFVDPMHTIETLADECCTTTKHLKEFLEFCDESLIFEKKDGRLYCPMILERLDDFASRLKANTRLDYGKNWEQQRKLARERDEYRCAKCGKTTKENGRSLEVHHIIPFKEFVRKIDGSGRIVEVDWESANSLDNLITLCIKCHNKQRKNNGKQWNKSGNVSTTSKIEQEQDINKIQKEEKETASLSYLKNIPESDLQDFTKRFNATTKQIISKGEDLVNWCEANGKRKKNYKAFLVNALKKDFKPRVLLTTPPKVDIPDVIDPQRMQEIRQKAYTSIGKPIGGTV